ncbi:19721_t:CDS:1, partial [Gigaspora rosea]
QEVKELTAASQIKCLPYNLIAEWVKHAWDDIDIQLIKCFFKCCGISIATDGSENHLLFDYDQVENNEINEHD